MDIYVKELPKSCYECDICYTDQSTDRLYTRCSLINDTDILGRDMNVSKHIDKRHNKCPLKSLKEYYKQVCKEVLDNLSINLTSTFTKEAEFTVEKIIDWLQNIKERINNET